MKSIKLAVFDMAGTTVNENNVVYKTVQKALAQAGVEVDLEMVLELGAGKEKLQAITDVLGHPDHGKYKSIDPIEVFENFKKMLKEAYTDLAVSPYDGVEELFETLRANDIKVVLNTGYDRQTAQSLLDKLGWKVGGQIDGLITADDVEIGRPSSEMIDKAREMFQIDDPSLTLKAGDSIIDMEEGQNANCGMTIGVLTGAHTRAQLESVSPTLILDALQDLGKVLFS